MSLLKPLDEKLPIERRLDIGAAPVVLIKLRVVVTFAASALGVWAAIR